MLWMLMIGAGWAQDVGPVVPQEVLSFAESSPCPDLALGATPRVVRLSTGLATLREDGTYTYVCGADWGAGAPTAAASSPDGRELLVVTPAGAWYSSTAGCGPERLELGEGEPVEALYWRQAFWVIQRDVAETRLARFDGERVTVVATWTDFDPSDAVAEGTEHLWLGGIRPQAELRRLTLAGGLVGNQALASLPADTRDVERIEPMAARDGQVWVRLVRRQDRWTWFGQVLDNGEVRWSSQPPGRNILGPAWQDGRWLRALDLGLQSANDQGAWVGLGDTVDWRCLDSLGETAYACRAEELVTLEGSTVEQTSVFSLAQLREPDDVCSPSAACLEEWDQVLEELGRDAEQEPAACPDGKTPSELEGESCGCGTAGGAPWWVVLLLAYGHRRTRGSSSSQSPRSGT